MLTFIVLLILSLAIAFFAGQNTTPVTIFLADSRLPSVPLYVVIVGAMLIGFVVSWFVSLIDSVFTIFNLRGKDHAIQAMNKKSMQLQDRVHELEVENARLKGEHTETVKEYHDDRQLRPTFFDRIKHAVR